MRFIRGIGQLRLWKFVFQPVLILVFLAAAFGVSPAINTEARNGQPAPMPDTISEAPMFAPAASVSLGMPASVLLRDDVTFTISFSNTGADPGFGPFIDLVIPATAGLGASSITVSYAGTSITPLTSTFSGVGPAIAGHPLARDTTGALITVDASTIDASIVAGDQLVTIPLPFGSFSPGQPAITVDVTVDMTSPPAQVGTPISIWARGGYQFGANPLDDWCCGDTAVNTLSAWVDDSVTPDLWTLSKSYSGPEGEAATGPNFRTFYPLQYTLAVDIAAGETVTNLVISDVLPNNLQPFSWVSTGGGTCTPNPLNTASPGSTIQCTFASATGYNEVTFDFYIPLVDSSSGRVITASSGDDVTSCDDASASGTWNSSPISNNSAACDHTLTDKSIAMQKSVVVNGGGILRPDVIIQNTLNFQVSDFFAFDDITIFDIVSDGQHFYNASGFEPTMQINGNGYTLAATDIDTANYDVACYYTGPGSECETSNPSNSSNPDEFGTTQLTFRVTDEIVTSSGSAQDGTLIGGCVNPAGGSATPNCGTYDNGATSGVIVFYTIALDDFTDIHTDPLNSNDSSLDQGDVITNEGRYIRGDVLDTDTLTPTGFQEDDDTSASLSVPLGTLSKSVYAITEPDGVTVTLNPADPIHIKPGDTVTYRITYEMPVSNEENLHLTDYLPLPIFEVGDPDADDYPAHSDGPAWTFSTAGGVPAAGVVTLGPADTFYDYMLTGNGVTGTATGNTLHPAATITPVVTSDVASNSITVAYPTYDDTRLTPRTVDLLLSVKVNNEPFADQLLLTNQAYSYEGSTNAGIIESTEIKQVILDQPLLITTKSAVWAGRWNGATWDVQPDAVFSPGLPVTILDPSNPVRWTGTITDGASVDSDVSRVDAGDVVTFMILIDNAGQSNDGAFDLIIKDSLPSIFSVPTTGLNLHILRGDGQGVDYGLGVEEIRYTGEGGAPVGFTGLPGDAGDLFGNGIRLTDPADVLGDDTPVCQAHNVASGQDIIVITYDLLINYGATAGTYTNTANNTNYAGENNGENHIPAPDTSPVWDERTTDTANTTIDASPEKFLIATSESDTLTTDVAIGEVVRYRVVSTVPEGSSPDFQIQDLLPSGLIFLDDDTTRVAFVSDNGINSSAIGLLPVPAVVNGACTVNLGGSTADATTPSSALLCTVADGNIGSNPSIDTDTDVYNSGTNPYFKFGDLVNVDDDLDSEFVVIEFNALVDNTTISGPIARNVAGDTLSNSAQAMINGVNSGSPSAIIDVTVVEPNVSFSKVIVTLPSPLDQGSIIHYRITYSNAGGSTSSTAYDVNITDTLASALLLPSTGSPDLVITYGGSGTVTNNSTTSSVDIVISTVAPGESVVVDFYPVVQSSITPGEVVDNIGDSTWTSLPGPNGTSGNGTGSDTPGASGDSNGERNGTGTNPPNSYSATDNDSFTSDSVTLVKQLTATSATHTSGANVAIGEEITYDILLTFPEGSTPSDVVVDDLPSGLEVVSGTPEVITTAAASGGLLTANFNGSLGTQGISTVAGDGGSVTFGFAEDATDIVVAGDNNVANNTILLRFRARVTNIAGNQTGTVISNSATNQVGSGMPVTSNTVTATVVEPNITFGKAIVSVPSPLDAGGVIHYRISYSNGSGANVSTAMDVRITDVLASALLLDAATSPNPVISASAGVGAITNNSSSTNIDILIASVPPGESVTVDFYAEIQTSITPGEVVGNTGVSTWTSLSGADANERDGSGGVNDYTSNATVNITSDVLAPVKSIVSTSAAHTSETGDGSAGNPRDLTIGEIIRYRLAVQVPEGTTSDLQLVDTLPAGFTFLNDGDIRISFIADVDMTEDVDLAGADNDALPATFALPAGRIGVVGQDVTFTAGDLVNNDSDINEEYVVVDFNVVVNNDANNNNTDLDNNDFDLFVDSVNVATSNAVQTRIVESILNISKAVSDPTPAEGQVLTFTLTVSHAGASNATAFDLAITDSLSSQLVLDLNSISYLTSGTVTSVDTSNSSGNDVNITVGAIATGGTLTITFEATVAAPFGEPTFQNLAEVTWTSLPGSDAGERDGSQTPAYNDYHAEDQVDIDVDRDLSKSLVASNVTTTNPLQITTVGEILTYQIVLTIPGGSTDTAIITDTLDDGLAFVDCAEPGAAGVEHDLIAGPDITSTNFTFAADAHGHNVSSCNHGTVSGTSNPVISNSGRTIQFDLGDITNGGNTPETITLTYRVVVLDIAANVQDQNVLLDNDVDWTWSTGEISTFATPSVEIIEPDMQIEKTVDPEVAVLGSTVTYTIDIGHTPLSQTTAYDVIVTDAIPSGLILDELSVAVNTTGGVSASNIVTSPTLLTVSWDEFPLGGTATITFDAIFAGPNPVFNTSSVEWSTLEIDPILGVSVQQSPYNSFSTERRYDPLDTTGVNDYTVSSTVVVIVPSGLPRTGFAPGRITDLPEQPDYLAYTALGDLWLEIPDLGVKVDIVGVPFEEADWNLTWLAGNAGYLGGTAYPTYAGNTGITAHAYLADGTPGPFANLDKLSYGDQIIVHLGGQQYIYEVREEKLLRPDSVNAALKHEEYPWLTLITCKVYSEYTKDYVYRTVVRAVLVDVIPE